jgi:Galactose oxidase-like, Early set domain/Kelch motif
MRRVVRFTSLLCAVLGLSLAGRLPPGASSPVVHAQPDPAVVGQWSALQAWPVVSVHAALMPNGRVAYYSYADDIRSWDPSTGTTTAGPLGGFNLFCSGLTLLSDGRLFVAGGHISNNVGVKYASIYDSAGNVWARQPDMNAGRWYPTTTTLSDGSVLVVSGDTDTTVGVNKLPQVWTTNGTWRNLTGALRSLDLYPMMLLAPNGKVFDAGPATDGRYLDTTGTGSWSDVVAYSSGGFRGYGTAVMYEPGKILLAGGNDPPVASAEVIDLNQSAPYWSSGGSMSVARRQLNATVLPDGRVLITGGSSAAGFNTPSGAVYTAERWDPATKVFTTLSSATRYRGYHSIALLLPDGRVLSSGGDNEPNAEVFSPPYLFQGSRPDVSSAPSTIAYGQPFFVGTSAPSSISGVTLIRLSAVTHAFNMNQRFVRLTFSQASGGLNATAPAAAEIAPPGHYMLFLLNSAGVPSIARIVRLGTASPSPSVAAPTGLTASQQGNQMVLAWTDASNNEDGFRIERASDGSNFAQIATVAQNVTTYTDASPGSSRFVYYRVRAYSGTLNSGYSNTVRVRNR